MGYLPGFATPRIVCDVPFVGKRWVHQLADYDTRARHLLLDEELPHRRSRPTDPEALTRTYEYYDPIHTLPEAGQEWWAEHGRLDESAPQGRRGGRGLPSYGGAPGLLRPARWSVRGRACRASRDR